MGQLARAVSELGRLRPEALRALAESPRPVQALAAVDQGRAILCVRLGDAAARVARDAVVGSARKVEVGVWGCVLCFWFWFYSLDGHK